MEKVRFKNEENMQLAGILHIPERPLKTGVVIAHGFTGHKDANFIPELSRNLEEAGYPVLRFDFRGNGESAGRFEEGTWTAFSSDLGSAINYMKSRGFDRIYVIGFSMGGAVSIITYSRFRNFNRLVLVAPAIKPASDTFIKLAWRQLKKQDFVEFEDARGRIWRLNRSYFEDREKYDLLSMTIDIPVLVIIGEKDRAVSIEAAREFSLKDPKRRKFVIIPDEDHVFHNTSRNLFPHILKFFEYG